VKKPATLDVALAQARVAAYLNPRNVVIVGASDRPGSWGARVHRNLRRYDYPGRLHFINPSRNELAGQVCHRNFDSLPEAPDHVLILTPAFTAPSILRQAANAGARSATVYSAGFGEGMDANAAQLGIELRRAIDETGLAITGPNCMGSVSGPSGFVSLTEDRPLLVKPGPVALVGQSGGVMMFVNQSLEERGLQAGYIITNGNNAGLTSADFIAFFATRPEIKVIIIYVEAMRDIERFRVACNHAHETGKHVIAIKLGATPDGRGAAMAHTGSLAGEIEAFESVTAEMGVLLAATPDDAVEMTELLCHTGAPKGHRIGAITLSGAYRGLLLDAAAHAGVTFPPLAQETLGKLASTLTVGSLIGNPIDGGFGVLSSEANYLSSIDALENDPNVDVILVQDSLPRAPGYDRAERYINLVQNHIGGKRRKPLAFIALASHGQTDYSRRLHSQIPDISFLQEANKALRAIACVADRAKRHRIAQAVPPPHIDETRRALCLRLLANTTGPTLNEAASRNLVAQFGIHGPKEAIVRSETEAIAAAQAIGFPVVLKILSSTISHKSDVGGVALNIRDAAELAGAWRKICSDLGRHGVAETPDRFLVAQYVTGGLEFALGVHRDPEVGYIVMIGSGGVRLELYKDIAFGAPPLSSEKAQSMLSRTKVSQLLAGYRAAPAHDRDALASAIVAMGQIAVELSDQIQSIDVNPLLVMPGTGGCMALDALVVPVKTSMTQ
jgi:acetyltransferase